LYFNFLLLMFNMALLKGKEYIDHILDYQKSELILNILMT